MDKPPEQQHIYIEVNRDQEYRCTHEIDRHGTRERCNKCFFKGEVGSGTRIEIKCPRCKKMCRLFKQ